MRKRCAARCATSRVVGRRSRAAARRRQEQGVESLFGNFVGKGSVTPFPARCVSPARRRAPFVATHARSARASSGCPAPAGTSTPPATATYARAPRMRSPNLSTEPARASTTRFISTGASSSVRAKLRARHRKRRRRLESKLRPHQRHFQRRCVAGSLPNKTVRQPMRKPVHRAADRHASRLKSPAAQVLHGREHAGAEDRKRGHRSRRHEPHAVSGFQRETAPRAPNRTASSRSAR